MNKRVLVVSTHMMGNEHPILNTLRGIQKIDLDVTSDIVSASSRGLEKYSLIVYIPGPKIDDLWGSIRLGAINVGIKTMIVTSDLDLKKYADQAIFIPYNRYEISVRIKGLLNL